MEKEGESDFRVTPKRHSKIASTSLWTSLWRHFIVTQSCKETSKSLPTSHQSESHFEVTFGSLSPPSESLRRHFNLLTIPMSLQSRIETHRSHVEISKSHRRHLRVTSKSLQSHLSYPPIVSTALYSQIYIIKELLLVNVEDHVLGNNFQVSPRFPPASS